MSNAFPPYGGPTGPSYAHPLPYGATHWPPAQALPPWMMVPPHFAWGPPPIAPLPPAPANLVFAYREGDRSSTLSVPATTGAACVLAGAGLLCIGVAALRAQSRPQGKQRRR